MPPKKLSPQTDRFLETVKNFFLAGGAIIISICFMFVAFSSLMQKDEYYMHRSEFYALSNRNATILCAVIYFIMGAVICYRSYAWRKCFQTITIVYVIISVVACYLLVHVGLHLDGFRERIITDFDNSCDVAYQNITSPALSELSNISKNAEKLLCSSDCACTYAFSGRKLEDVVEPATEPVA